jgi:hypothetical protein
MVDERLTVQLWIKFNTTNGTLRHGNQRDHGNSSAMDQLRHGTSFAVGTGSAVRTSMRTR